MAPVTPPKTGNLNIPSSWLKRDSIEVKQCHAYSIIQKRELKVAIHGDDFTILGAEKDLNWFREQIKSRFEVKFRGRIGPSEKDDKSIRLLNRVFEWTPEGIVVEADQRHAELIVQDLGLNERTKSVSTPGLKSKGK